MDIDKVASGQNQADEILGQLLQRAMDGVDEAVAFSQAQIPDVVSQLLVWKVTQSIVTFVVGLALMALAVLVWRWATRLHSKAVKAKEDGEQWAFFGISKNVTSMTYDVFTSPLPKILAIMVALVGFMVSTNIMTVLKIWIAPKLYLLEYSASLVK